jgi:hypothetical protein
MAGPFSVEDPTNTYAAVSVGRGPVSMDGPLAVGKGPNFYVTTSGLAYMQNQLVATVNSAVTVLLPSGDTTGVADSASILAALTGQVYVCLAPGTFYISSPIAMSSSQWLQGSGPGTTSVVNGSAFTGSEFVSVTANGCKISDLRLAGNSTTPPSNPQVSAIEVSDVQRFHALDLRFQYINGYCIEGIAATGGIYGGQIRGIIANNCDGGIHIKSVSGLSYGGQWSLTDINMQQLGVGTSGLDVIFLEDVEDIQCVNFNTSISDVSTASSMHIKGACATIYMANMDLGCYPNGSGTNYVWLIEDGANGSPSDIRITNGVGQQGTYGTRVTGGANHLSFVNFRAFNNYAHGISMEGTGADVKFDSCAFASNGQGSTGTNYDMNWSGTGTGQIMTSTFSSLITGSGTAGVQNAVQFHNTAQNVPVANCIFNGAGATTANIFATKPISVRTCSGFNPFGAITLAVPGSGTASATLQMDSQVYVNGDASDSVTLVIGGNQATRTLTIAAGAQNIGVLLPANTTLTPTYTAGHPPTWAAYAS